MSRAMLVAAGVAALGGASCAPTPLYGVPIMRLDSGAGGSSGTAGTGGASSNGADGAAGDANDGGAEGS